MHLTCPNAQDADGVIQPGAYLRLVRRRPWQAGVIPPHRGRTWYAPKYLYLSVAAASAAVLAAPIVADASPAAHSHLLTIKKAGGTPVRPAAALKASLVKGTSADFSIGTLTITCKSSSFT